MSAKKGARLVPISEEILREITLLAERTGKPTRTLVNEILMEALKVVSRTDVRPEEAIMEYIAIYELKKLGFTLIPLRLLNSLLDSSEDLKLWEEVGSMYGSVFKIKGGDVEELRRCLKVMFLDASDIAISRSDETLELSVISMGRSKRACEASKAVIKGFMEAQGYKLMNFKIGEGIVIASFRRQQSEEKSPSS